MSGGKNIVSYFGAKTVGVIVFDVSTALVVEIFHRRKRGGFQQYDNYNAGCGIYECADTPGMPERPGGLRAHISELFSSRGIAQAVL